ncbi:RNA-guided endonuclease TnpB family protein [Cyanobacterium aponinum AL20118]|uniref:RNA-guided endonuclease TnpB family protein n=2 Tax=Cyanobacterium aponinum TaxID=379064 RepID=A0AAF0ZJ18_9CHRO|nr:RNA-guided endonuclease TnpB family protein [Cyanobacterium aponinum]WPF89102.1 RNA-guided endonuclease TnpB family protein [Cyanobacterium aponinum AL20115]
MKQRYNYRVYPTSQQEQLLAQLFGCCRVVYNDGVALCQQIYKEGGKKPSNSELQKLLITQAKKTEKREWLSKVSAIPLQQSLNDFNIAYQNFFNSCQGKRKGKKVKPPKFKSRKSNQSARFTRGGFKVGQHKIKLAKIGKVKIIWSRKLPNPPSSATVIKDSASRYFISFVVETIPEKLPDNGQSVGIDLGIETFATLSNGQKIKSSKPLKKYQRKLRRCQRNLSRKKKGSKRDEKARKRVAKVHSKIKDTRTDFLHKLSTDIIRENQTIVLEDLNVSAMVKNRKLSKAISDLGWGTFRTLLEAKSVMYGREFIVIDRWIPTSQVCSNCGFNGGKKELNIREWTCINCGVVHDRDINASKNILVAGGHSETLNGRGAGRKTSIKLAVGDEASTHREIRFKHLSLFQ